MGDHVIGFITGGISKSIAITSELIAGQKGKDSARARADANRTSLDEDSSEDENETEQEWFFDAAEEDACSAVTPTDCGSTPVDCDKIPTKLNQIPQTSIKPLPQAVLIPQRRPGDRRRGFIRAYAPVLADSKQIEQEDFLQFLDSFNNASKSSPVFDVINLACFGVGLVPSTICVAVATAVGTVNAVAQELQMRYRTNSYLDKANREVFVPRNCCAMLMTYKPDMPDDLVLQADISSGLDVAITKTLPSDSKVRSLLKRLKKTSGTTSEAQMPECAPLIHPDLDKALATTSLVDQNSSFMKKNGAIVNSYLDRRAQTNFATNNPTSKITKALPGQQSQYVNRFADPNHPVNSGSIFGLLTGGTFDPIATGRIRRAEMHAKKNGQPPLTDEEKHDAYMGRKVRGRVTGTPSKKTPIIGKILKKDVLYLLIVEMPTEEQMMEVQQALGQET